MASVAALEWSLGFSGEIGVLDSSLGLSGEAVAIGEENSPEAFSGDMVVLVLRWSLA